MTDQQVWIFGYGSLMWKFPDHVVETRPGFIKGHVRRFWQESTDHRGTEEYPGRVVTLIPHEEWKRLGDVHICPAHEVTWGLSLRIDPEFVEEVLNQLDIRENNGYTVQSLPVYISEDAENPDFNAIVYIGTTNNSAYVGLPNHDVSVDSLAKRIVNSRGPSGENREYLYRLAESLRQLSPFSKDQHVWDLEECARAYEHELSLISKSSHFTEEFQVQVGYDSGFEDE